MSFFMWLICPISFPTFLEAWKNVAALQRCIYSQYFCWILCKTFTAIIDISHASLNGLPAFQEMQVEGGMVSLSIPILAELF